MFRRTDHSFDSSSQLRKRVFSTSLFTPTVYAVPNFPYNSIFCASRVFRRDMSSFRDIFCCAFGCGCVSQLSTGIGCSSTFSSLQSRCRSIWKSPLSFILLISSRKRPTSSSFCTRTTSSSAYFYRCCSSCSSSMNFQFWSFFRRVSLALSRFLASASSYSTISSCLSLSRSMTEFSPSASLLCYLRERWLRLTRDSAAFTRSTSSPSFNRKRPTSASNIARSFSHYSPTACSAWIARSSYDFSTVILVILSLRLLILRQSSQTFESSWFLLLLMASSYPSRFLFKFLRRAIYSRRAFSAFRTLPSMTSWKLCSKMRIRQLTCFSTRSAESSFMPFWISRRGTSNSSLSRNRLIDVMNSPIEEEIFRACCISPPDRFTSQLYRSFTYTNCDYIPRERSNSPANYRHYPSSTASPSFSLSDAEIMRKMVSTVRQKSSVVYWEDWVEGDCFGCRIESSMGMGMESMEVFRVLINWLNIINIMILEGRLEVSGVCLGRLRLVLLVQVLVETLEPRRV